MATILGRIWRSIGLRLWNRGFVEYERMIADCEKAVDAVREFLPVGVDDDIRSYFYVREACVGMEILVDKLGDIDARLSSEQFETVETAALAVGVGADRMNYLRKFVIPCRNE